MTKEKMEEWGGIIAYLAACALHDIFPEERMLEGVDVGKLYQVSSFHAVAAIVCMALEKTDVYKNAMPEWKKKWQDAKNKSIRKNILLDAEREQLFSWMEEEGIWYMPLKGSVLKDLYPKPGMRQMADNDILYAPEYQQSVCAYMQEHGYETVSLGVGNHDVYKKLPVYNFEMHTALFGDGHHQVWKQYYQNVEDRLEKDADNSCGYHFREEDFYVYVVVHAYKHYRSRGTGLRSLLDIYVFIWKRGENLDWNYVRQETEKLAITEFEQQCRNLSERLFGDPECFYAKGLPKNEQDLMSFLSTSGVYGTKENYIKNKLANMQADGREITSQTKMKYLMQWMFLPNETLKTNLQRIVKRGIPQYKQILKEIRKIWKM